MTHLKLLNHIYQPQCPLWQLESRKDDDIDQSELSTETKALISSGPEGASAKDDKGSEGADIGMEEIVKELRVIRKQNTVTHWLLSVLIVVTAVWQMSEVSLLLYLKDSVKHPFKAIGGLITGSLGRSNEYDATKSNSSSKQHQIESIPLPHQIKMSELLSMEMSSLGLNGQNQDWQVAPPVIAIVDNFSCCSELGWWSFSLSECIVAMVCICCYSLISKWEPNWVCLCLIGCSVGEEFVWVGSESGVVHFQVGLPAALARN